MSLSIYHTDSHSLGHMREEKLLEQERDYCCWEIIFMFSGFTFGVDSISEEVVGFSPLWFPRGKTLCSLSLMFYFCACYSIREDPKIILLK